VGKHTGRDITLGFMFTRDPERFHDSHAGYYSEPSRQAVAMFHKAYLHLINHEDPDGWLHDFLNEHQEFKQHIGGYPWWLSDTM
jgi:hypothetical protein